MNPKDQLSRSSENLKQSVSSEPSSSSSDTANNASISSTVTRQWGEERIVLLNREDDKGLGISIVGGKVEMFNISAGSAITGIFIKNILSDSPAGREGTLKSGDRLLEVDGVDLRDATHDRAVEAIKNAKNPIKFVVQSLLPLVSISSVWKVDSFSPFSNSQSTSHQNWEHTLNPTESSLASSATLAAVESVPEEDVSSAKDLSEESSSPHISGGLDSSKTEAKDTKVAIDLNVTLRTLL